MRGAGSGQAAEGGSVLGYEVFPLGDTQPEVGLIACLPQAAAMNRNSSAGRPQATRRGRSVGRLRAVPSSEGRTDIHPQVL
jgi:hypothetical protein